jgi:hypothetical protein
VLRVDLDYRQIRFGIGADDVPLELPFIRQRDCHGARIVDHVVVRQNVAIR